MSNGSVNKKLKFWNGRSICILPFGAGTNWHVYVAAFSVDDLLVLAEELKLEIPTKYEVNTYFSRCWGDSMKRVVPERGIWVCHTLSRDKPVRVTHAIVREWRKA